MTTDSSFLDQLAETEVPVPPEDFQERLHGRLNEWLLIVHVGDLIAGAFPFAVRHFARAVGGLVSLTLTGKYPSTKKPRRLTHYFAQGDSHGYCCHTLGSGRNGC